MGTYASLQKAFSDENGNLSTVGQLGAGLCAGMIEAVLVVTVRFLFWHVLAANLRLPSLQPFELVKTRLQEQKGNDISTHKYKSTMHATSTIVKEEGIIGLWNGVSPTMVRNGVNQMALFFVKDNADRVLWGKGKDSEMVLQTHQSFISGACAGAAGPLVSAPMDIIKTRFQSINGSILGSGVKYGNIFTAMSTITKEEGFSTMWVGLAPRVIRLALGQAVTWTVTDKLIQYMSPPKNYEE
jgi:solute carrier family 25 citrate transporter 1